MSCDSADIKAADEGTEREDDGYQKDIDMRGDGLMMASRGRSLSGAGKTAIEGW